MWRCLIVQNRIIANPLITANANDTEKVVNVVSRMALYKCDYYYYYYFL